MFEQKVKRSIIWKISKEELSIIVENNNTFSDILKVCGLYPHGNNQKTLQKRLDQENIDYSKIKRGLNNRKGISQCCNEKIPLDKVLVEKSTYSRASLKKRLINEGLIENKCSKCNLGPEWCGEKLSLQIDHINGVPDDNRINNLRILCPNCHSQTSNFAGKQKKIVAQITDPNWRSKPRLNMRKVPRPSKEELVELLMNNSMVKVGKMFNVSDNAVRKWMKTYELVK
jgi:Zn finger protein HypA/HybF involved in hydrogenase expression